MFPMRLVLDTNVVMDLLHFADPRLQPLAAALTGGRVQLFTDGDCLAELERVAAYAKFALPADAQAALLETYRNSVTRCDADGPEDFVLPRCRDGDDQKFLVLAARCRAELLVTRDKMLLRLAGHRRTPPPFAIVTGVAACARLTG